MDDMIAALSGDSTPTFSECFDENFDLNFWKYYSYLKKREHEYNERSEKIKKHRKVYPRKDPKTTTWYTDYVMNNGGTFSNPDHRDGKLFRLRFRVPYSKYQWMVDECRREGWWVENPDAFDRPGAPIELLILGTLRLLGRGWVFDDIYEATRISIPVLRAFYHKFTKHYATDLREEWIRAPTDEEVEETMRLYEQSGFPGAIGSIDCVHVWWDRCPVNIANVCLGKEKYPTLAWQVVVNHKRRILSVSRSHYGAENDLTIARYDQFIMDMHWGHKYKDVEFELYNAHGNTEKITGLCLLCDGGYHLWRILQCPIRWSSVVEEKRWSRWLESLRKDVECTFGILKGRFRILKCGIRMQKRELLHNTFITCCVIHNMLLDEDGLEEGWDGINGCHDDADVQRIFRRAQAASSTTDTSGMGRGNYHARESDQPQDVEVSIDYEDAHVELQQKLITHFNYMWKKNNVKWAKRNDTST